jgi:hypothetical protein
MRMIVTSCERLDADALVASMLSKLVIFAMPLVLERRPAIRLSA